MTTYRNTHRRDPMPGTTANRPPLKPSLDSSAYHPARVIPGTIKPCRLIMACAVVVTIIFAASWL